MKTGGKHAAVPADPDALAAEALGFLADDPERLGTFLATTGLDPRALRQAAAAPDFARGILGYVASDEALVIGFAERIGASPERLGLALARTLHSGADFE